ncbi:MAG: AAA family ATPase [Clostridium butyricum]|nr:AAA family ATPase [Clostridium butyricum]
MYISEVKIKGFRNFKEDTINFKLNSLIIGENDIGKSNLIYALRILLDKSISEADLEPKDKDFYAFEETNEFHIQIKFDNITEECI